MPAEPPTPSLITVDAALATVLQQCTPPAGVQMLPLTASLGRYLAAGVVAPLDLPPFTNSAMDGYAVRAADTPGQLIVVGESAAGAPFAGTLGPGEAVTISTGAVLPDGADSVAILEEVVLVKGKREGAPREGATREGAPREGAPREGAARDGAARDGAGTGSRDGAARDGAGTGSRDGATVEVKIKVPLGDCVRAAGSDVRRGAEVLPAGTRIGAAQIGAVAGLGLGAVGCVPQPRVAILATGTELRAPGEPLLPGQIYNSNVPLLEALVTGAGGLATVIGAAADTREAHRTALAHALDHDVAISTGGVSVGGHDLVREVLMELGVEELFWRIAMKPGKPLSFGVRRRDAAEPGQDAPGRGAEASSPTLVFGLPGNPVSVLACFEMFVRPALAALQGSLDPRPVFRPARLAASVESNPQRDELIRVRLTTDGALEPLPGQQSHQLGVAARADGLAWIPRGGGSLAAGTDVGYLSLGPS